MSEEAVTEEEMQNDPVLKAALLVCASRLDMNCTTEEFIKHLDNYEKAVREDEVIRFMKVPQ